jgi:polar amino acid transport system ATP-binding protein
MLRLENVCYSVYDNGCKKDILTNINLEINKGETIVITGHNGSGKSTLLKCIMGIIPVTSGKIYFNNQDITKKGINLSEVRRKMGMVFQQFNLFPHLTVLENIMLAPVKLGVLTEKEAKKMH